MQQNQEIVLERWTPVLVNGCDLKITGYVKRYGILYCFFKTCNRGCNRTLLVLCGGWLRCCLPFLDFVEEKNENA
jgi:hypothetical protein